MDKRPDTDMAKSIILLNELQSQFERGILQGNSFEEVKKIYMRIKDVELHIKELKLLKDKSGL